MPSSRTRSKTRNKNADDKAEEDNDEADDKATLADLNSKVGTLLKNTPDPRVAQKLLVRAIAPIAT